MKLYSIIDENGIYLEDVFLDETEPIPPNHITPTPGGDSGRYVHKWNRDTLAWEEGGTAPPPAIPSIVSMRQARLALLQVGLLQTINSTIATMSESSQIEWEFSQAVNRDYGLVAEMIPLLGLSEVEVDNLFVLAAGL